MENDKIFNDEEVRHKLIIQNRNDIKEFICELCCGEIFTKERIDDSSIFYGADEDVENDFYATYLDDILEKNESVSFINLNHIIKIN